MENNMSYVNKKIVSLAISTALFTWQAQAAERINVEQHNIMSQHNIDLQQLLSGAEENSYQLSIAGLADNALTPSYVKINHLNEQLRYTQHYQGVEVYGVSLAAQLNVNNGFTNISGTHIANIASDLESVEATFSVEDALAKALAQAPNNLTSADVYNIESKLYIWLDDKDIAHLAWLVSYVDTSTAPTRPHFFIDAHTGDILEHWDGMAFAKGTGPGGNARTGRYHFGENGLYPAFNVLGSGSNCRLDSENVVTWDMKHKKSGGSAHSFACYENTDREVNQSYSALNDAHSFGQSTFNMYKDWYNAAPIRQKLKLRVHYDRDYENAFWDGQQMTFGDGKTTFHPLVSVGVVAHEVSHGFTQQNSNLAYKNQSGGLNESFSDIAAAAVSYYLTGSFSWKIGDKIKKGSGFMRSMDNPPADGRSIGHTRDYRSGMNVHYSSGVYNKAFYLLAETAKWDIKKAFNVYVKANQVYWNANETFDGAGKGVYKAAKALGYCVNDVLASLTAVGVNNSGAKDGSGCTDFPGEDPVADFSYKATKLDVQFTDSSTDDKGIVSHSWDFGDNTSSTQANPSHRYAADGTFSVSLTVMDADGASDMKTQVITVTKGGSNDCDGVAAWDASKSYSIGDIVSYKNYRYEGIWWSTGSKPDVFSNVWKNVGKCSGNVENEAPVAQFDHNANKRVVSFSDQSTDDKGVVSHSWNFGDGNSSTMSSPTHTYAGVGSYSVQLTVRDSEGKSDTASSTITVTDGDNPTCSAPPWNATTVYTSGEKAAQNGKEYQANWWTQGQSPENNSGQWKVWTFVSTCP